jgi:hypothetical protein
VGALGAGGVVVTRVSAGGGGGGGGAGTFFLQLAANSAIEITRQMSMSFRLLNMNNAS